MFSGIAYVAFAKVPFTTKNLNRFKEERGTWNDEKLLLILKNESSYRYVNWSKSWLRICLWATGRRASIRFRLATWFTGGRCCADETACLIIWQLNHLSAREIFLKNLSCSQKFQNIFCISWRQENFPLIIRIVMLSPSCTCIVNKPKFVKSIAPVHATLTVSHHF